MTTTHDDELKSPSAQLNNSDLSLEKAMEKFPGIRKEVEALNLAAHIDELEMALMTKGKTLVGQSVIDADKIECDPDVIYPSLLEARLAVLKSQQQENEG